MTKNPWWLFLLVPALCSGGDKKAIDPRLKVVRAIFVKGNSEAADKAREMLREGKRCFQLAMKPEDADATMGISDSATGDSGLLKTRTNVVSGTLTLKNGDLVWSHSERFSDDPLRSGGKVAASLLLRRLEKDSACRTSK